jgi:hypothetical protein
MPETRSGARVLLARLACSVCGFLCLTVFLARAGAGDDKELHALVDKAAKAMGGADKLAKFKTNSSKGQGAMYVPGKIPFTEEGWAHFPKQFRYDFELDINGVKIKEWLVIDGSKGWLKVVNKTNPLTKIQQDGFRAYFHAFRLASLPHELKDAKLKLAPFGEVKVGERSAVGVQVSAKDYPDVNVFFDKENALPLRCEFVAVDYLSGQEVTHEFLFNDYREVEGAKLPFRMVWNKDGKKFAERETSEIKSWEPDNSVFAEP